MSPSPKFRIGIAAAFAFAAPVFLPGHARVAAQNSGDAKEMIKVVAHLPLPGSAVRQIFLQGEGGRQYVYLQQNVHFTVVDVSDPGKPQIVNRVASDAKLTEVGAGLAIAVKSDQPGDAPVATQTIKLMDMSDPKNPRVAKTFTGVTSIYSDDARHLIFLTNSEGLWIVKHSQSHRLPLCTSESEENSVVQCR
jgi:hypothetical protein